jgi:hypothetical protein
MSDYPRGVSVDEHGSLHFDIAEMVRGAGFEPTPDNMAAMEAAARQMAEQVGATVEVYDDEVPL